jgi:hypothetical protein
MPDFIRRRSESVWKKLTRLFRSGPPVRHKVASGENYHEPQGTARAYKKELSSLYVHSLASYGQYERLSRYADYTEMEFTPEIASTLDIYADEVTAPNENDEVLQIHSKNNDIKRALKTLYQEVINIDFNAWSWVRNLCKYGDFVLFVDASESNGIINLLPIPINEIEREEGYDKNDPFAVRFRWLTQGNKILENWQIIHFRLLGNDNFLPYGSSIIEPARRIWRQLILIEDAMLVYRIVRSPERRVFYIDVGNVPPNEMEQFMNQIQTRLKRSQVVDSTTGRVDLRYNPLSVDEDYYIPVRDQRSSRIETLAGGQMLNDIEDVQYIQSKLFAALKVPKSYLNYEGDLGSKATLASQDVRFAKTIARIQRIFIAELNKIAIIHLFLLGFRGEDLVDFEIGMSSSSQIAIQQKLELIRMKAEITSLLQEGTFDRRWSQKNIWKLSDEEIEEIDSGRIRDRLYDLHLEQVQLPPEAQTAAAAEVPEEEEPVAGEEELPTTLGGDVPQEEPVEQLPEEGVQYEVHNPGSTGDSAELAVDKGKDLFSTGEDQHELVFGTKKQTASDPYDLRYTRRMVSRPFSEVSGKTPNKDLMAQRLIEAISRTFKIEEDVENIRSSNPMSCRQQPLGWDDDLE